MRILFCCILLALTCSSQAQFNYFNDPRDGNVYETVTIGNKTWFRENLRLRTDLAHFKDSSQVRLGNYYSNLDLGSVCPPGWHVATVEELREYILFIARKNNVGDTNIIITRSKDADSSLMINVPGVRPGSDSLLNLVSLGWVEGGKIKKDKAFTMWLTDSQGSDNKFHAHIGALGYIIHTHFHNIIDKPKKVRKFVVRCVCEIK